MRSFMVLCLVALTAGAPQYNYQQPAQASVAQPISYAAQPVAQPQQQVQYQPQQQIQQQVQYQPQQQVQQQVQYQPQPQVQQQVQYQPQQQVHQPAVTQTVYNKQFFIHSAPEDEALEGANSAQENSVLKKNLRVVIVKAPENKGLTNAALQLAKSASEDKTVVYVLNKQHDLGELQNQLSQIQASNPNKPEVHFVKYKTPEEAEHAQHSIQSQYDSFGGPSQVLNEGVAPVESYVGSLGGGTAGSIGAGSSQQASFQQAQSSFGSVQNSYLPALRL